MLPPVAAALSGDVDADAVIICVGDRVDEEVSTDLDAVVEVVATIAMCSGVVVGADVDEVNGFVLPLSP